MMSEKRNRIETALQTAGTRYRVDAIDDNPGSPGEVVLWIDGAGRPVYSVREARALVAEVIRTSRG